MGKSKEPQGMSILTMTILIGIVVTYLLWGVATAMYDADQGNRWLMPVPDENAIRRRPSPIAIFVAGIIAFVANSVMYIPSMFQVFAFILTQRTWFLIIVGLVEAGVIAFGFGAAQVEKSVSSNGGFKTKRKPRKMALPAPSDD